VKLESDLCIQ